VTLCTSELVNEAGVNWLSLLL